VGNHRKAQVQVICFCIDAIRWGPQGPRLLSGLRQRDLVKSSKPKFDCLKCPGYCCSHPRIAVTDNDIARLAKHFDLGVAKARKKFTYVYKDADTREVILRHHKDHV
jgi:hypothetical protein